MANVIKSIFGGDTDTTIKLDSDGTQYFLSIKILNSKGEYKSFTSTSFAGLTFESDFNSPFIAGQLQIDNKGNQNLFNSLPDVFDEMPKKIRQYSSTFDGQEFLFIQIRKKNFNTKTCSYADEIMLDKPFVITNTINSTLSNNSMTNYYFTDLIVADLLYTRKEWTSNVLIGKNKKTLSKFSNEELQVNGSTALKRLITDFTYPEIIDNDEWDSGRSTLEYTLPKNAPAMQAITYMLENYVSSNEDLGILTYLGGQFQLTSLKDIFAQVYQKNNNQKIFKERFTNAFKVQTEDTDVVYTNKEAERLLPNSFQFIPINQIDIDFTEPDPISGINTLIDHSLITYNNGSKTFNLFNKTGTVEEVRKDFSDYLKTFPDADEIELNVPANDFYKLNKVTNFNTSNSPSQTTSNSQKSKISLQRKMLQYLSRCKFKAPGNFNICANKFLYLTVTVKEKNDFLTKVPGFWYITKSTTTLKNGTFETEVTASKFDRPIPE